MRLQPDTYALTIVLALMTAVGPLSTDMYLPSLPAIAGELQAGTSRVQLTLSAFLVGFAVGQVVYGPLSDRHGRRPVLAGALILFIAASAACAAASSIEGLIVARFGQALGASGPIVLARAVVRDLYEGARAGRELSRMGTIMGLVPAVAPVFGGLLHEGFGWRASFVATVVIGTMLAGTVWLFLPETLARASPERVSPGRILRGFAHLLRNRLYRVHVGLAALTYGGLFTFISASSFVLQGVYGLSELAYGLSFGICVLGYITGTMLATRLVRSRGLERTMALGVLFLAGGALAMLAGVAAGPRHAAVVVGPMMLYLCGVGLVLPQAVASAMQPFPDRAGAASSLLGTVQMSFAALVGVVAGWLIDASPLPLPVLMSLTGCGALVLFRASAGLRRAGG